jgi:dinuclear metal center YbgI/SA1388 family protein
MACRVDEVAALMEEIAPLGLAAEGDNVGLLLGDPAQRVERVLLTIDVTGEVVEEAGRRGAGMIVAHHPLIFRPLHNLVVGDPVSNLVMEMIRRGISLYAAHTNLDASEQGVNAALADALGLVKTRPLEPARFPHFKLVTFLPVDSVDRLREAVFKAGAGVIGKYSRCSFYAEGVGTFLAGEGTEPSVGRRGEEERVRECRLEFLVEGRRIPAVLSALREAHPYEEPAVDLYPLDNPGRLGHLAGIGRMGELEEPLTLEGLAKRCREALGCEEVRVFGDPGRTVRRVAVCGGRGGFLVPMAARVAEVLVTGDVDHHQALDAKSRGLALVDAGHYHTERPVIARLGNVLDRAARERGLEVVFLASEVDTYPGGAE